MIKDKEKDLALITSIIINEDVLGGTIFQTFDKAYALAEKFQDKFSHVRIYLEIFLLKHTLCRMFERLSHLKHPHL